MTTEKIGRVRYCWGPRRLDDEATWIAATGMLEAKLDRLGDFLERQKAYRCHGSTSTRAGAEPMGLATVEHRAQS